jgi:hypothetical protein
MRLFISIVTIVIMFCQPTIGQTYLGDFHQNKSRRSFDLEGSLHLLNLCKEQPDYVNRIYTTAFKHLLL